MEGNLRPDILYVGDGGGAKIYLRKGMVSYVLSLNIEHLSLNIEEEEEEKNPKQQKKKEQC